MRNKILKTIKKMRDFNFRMSQEARLSNKTNQANYFAGKTNALEEVYSLIKTQIENEIPWEV